MRKDLPMPDDTTPGALTPETLFTPELVADLIAADIRLIEAVGPDGVEPMESPQELAVIIVRYASDRLALARDWQRQRACIERLEKALENVVRECDYCEPVARAALAPKGAPDGE